MSNTPELWRLSAVELARRYREGSLTPRAVARFSSLRLLGTVGEPINPEAWMWYHEVIGKGKCPIVDTWWQTETGWAMISPLPGATPTVPGTATLPLPGILPDIVTKAGKPVGPGEGGVWPAGSVGRG